MEKAASSICKVSMGHALNDDVSSSFLDRFSLRIMKLLRKSKKYLFKVPAGCNFKPEIR